ncbi:MAG: zinc ABC transporter substrate-binding protein [Pseudomonadota bacterium]
MTVSKTLAPALALSAALSMQGAALAQTATVEAVATFSVLGDLTARIGGERVAVATLVGAGGDAHVYEPSPADAARVAKADLVIVNGLEFEGFIDRLIDASGTKATIVTATKGIDPLETGEHDDDEDGHDDHADHDDDKHADGHDDHKDEAEHKDEGEHDHGHDHGAFDPHAWHSIPNVRSYVANIADGLCAADADGCTTYRANAAAYTAELKTLETELAATLGALPEDKRTMIVSHDAFGYFAKAYDLTFLAPQGVSTEAEASAADVARLIDQVRDKGATALFVENIADPRLIEQIATETGLSIGGKLYSDALSPPDGPASTYIDMMRHNAMTVADAVAKP